MIKRASEMETKFFAFVKMMYNKMSEYDDLIYTLGSILENHNSSNYYVVCSNTQIMDIIGSGKRFGRKVLYPFFITGGEKCICNTIDNIRKYFKKDVLLDIDYINYEKYGLYMSDLNSSFSDFQYRLRGCYFVLNADEIYVVRDSIERTFFPPLKDTSAIEFKMIDGKDVSKYLYRKELDDYPYWEEKYGSAHILGFHYLAVDFYENNQLLVAEYKGVPIGCIKLGDYYMEYSYKHHGLNYIDVNYKYRKMGIAKLLIHELAKRIPSDMPLVLSSESEMGKLCHMEDHFKAETEWKTKLYTSKEWEEYQWERIRSSR